MKSHSRRASTAEVVLGCASAVLFWLFDAAIDKFVVASDRTYLDILIRPDTLEFHTRLLATILMLVLALVAAWLLRRKENAVARLSHGRFLLDEMAIQIGYKNERLRAEIGRRKAIEARLATLADTDDLTGLYNRRKFDELLAMELRREARYARGLGLMILDIDRFSEVNNQHGRSAGDDTLKELAYLVEGGRRDADAFFRLGGAQFALITFASNGANLETASDKLRKSVSGHAFETAQHLTVSIGASLYQPGDSPETLIKRAEDALRRAKHTGRDRAVIG